MLTQASDKGWVRSTKHIGWHASVGLVAGQIIYAIFAQYMYTRILLHPEAFCHSGYDLWWKDCRVERGLILC